MLIDIDVQLSYGCNGPTTMLLQLEADQGCAQTVRRAEFAVEGDPVLARLPGDEGIGSRIWLKLADDFSARYTAQVEVERAPFDLAGMSRGRLVDLPGDVVKYLFASRYCAPDTLAAFATSQFDGMPTGRTIAAMRDWIEANFTYDNSVSDASTGAEESFDARTGVCRDYAHVMIALARAISVPARMVSVYAPDVEPADFHAVAEVWLDGAWRLVDATGMATPEQMVRVGVGRDAADISFLTAFSPVTLKSQRVKVERG